MATEQQALTSLRRLIDEASDLCRRAQDLRLGEAEKNDLQRRFGAITAGTTVSFAFQGVLRRPVRDWLQRAESAIMATTRRSDVATNVTCQDLLRQLRHLVDTANAAVLRRSRSHETWTIFYSANAQARQSVFISEQRLSDDRAVVAASANGQIGGRP